MVYIFYTPTMLFCRTYISWGHLFYSWNLTSGFCLNSFLTSSLCRFFLCTLCIFWLWMRLLHVYNIQGHVDVFDVFNKENLVLVSLKEPVPLEHNSTEHTVDFLFYESTLFRYPVVLYQIARVWIREHRICILISYSSQLS